MRWLRLFFAILFGVLTLSVPGVAAAASAELAATELSTPEFSQRIDMATFDRRLLARAIFLETNRVRRLLGLRSFEASAQADVAAEMQASTGAMLGSATHDNPLAGKATPLDRAERAGLKPERVAENIAMSTVLDLRGVTPGYKQPEGEPRQFIDLRTGQEIPFHTYASFAADVVRQWMDSPGHRANIVDPAFRHLGCAVWPTRGISGADLLVSVQLFVISERLSHRHRR